MDTYDNAIFIANETTEPKTFKKLKKIFMALKEKFPDTFLPIHYSDEYKYVSLRLNAKFEEQVPTLMDRNDVYYIKFTIRCGQTKVGKQFINCLPTRLRLVSKAVIAGDLFEVSDSDESDAETAPVEPAAVDRSAW